MAEYGVNGNGRRWGPAFRNEITLGAVVQLFALIVAIMGAALAWSYSRAQEQAAAQALVQLPPGSVLARMMVDYARERAELRACRG